MKRIFSVIFALFFSINTALADVFPVYTDSVVSWGIGLAKVEKKIVIYKNNDETSNIVEVIVWDEQGNVSHKNPGVLQISNAFVAFVPSNNTALFAVDDEDDDWIKICYNQKQQKYGWIKKADGHKVIDWQDFFKTYGRKYGVYLFKDISKDSRQLYAKPQSGAQSVDSFTYTKNISPWLIRGNWMLVKIINYDNTKKTGWVKWRDESGKLLIFTYLK